METHVLKFEALSWVIDLDGWCLIRLQRSQLEYVRAAEGLIKAAYGVSCSRSRTKC